MQLFRRPIIQGINWKAVGETDEMEYVFLNGPKDIHLESKSTLGESEFWDSLPLKESERLFDTKDEL